MENTLENKAKFFALYWGQEVLTTSQWKRLYRVENYFLNDTWEVFKDEGVNQFNIDNIHLQLKPISSLSKYDFKLIEGNKIMNPESPNDSIDITCGKIGNINLSDLTTTDFLRSRGYALPWMGLSVEKLIEYGWIKLKED